MQAACRLMMALRTALKDWSVAFIAWNRWWLMGRCVEERMQVGDATVFPLLFIPQDDDMTDNPLFQEFDRSRSPRKAAGGTLVTKPMSNAHRHRSGRAWKAVLSSCAVLYS